MAYKRISPQPVVEGGTGAITLTSHGVLVGSGTSAVTATAAGSAGQVLQSAGASADPVYSTATYPATTTVSQILYSSSTNVVGGITTANNGTLITGATGIPSFLANGTTGQILTATTGSPPSWASPATSGTVTSVSVVTANGFAGTVATATTTPAITMTTSETGLLSGNGTAITGTAISQYNVITGGASNAPNSVAPSATSGVPLISQGASSQPVFGTAVVAGGGTGVTSTTAYAVLCGGTTSTGAVQSIASVGTSGQVLTSNGAGALPTFQTAASASPVWTEITSTAVSSQSTITYTSGITSYNEILIVFDSVTSSTTNNWRLNLATDGATYNVTMYGWQTTGAGTGFVNGTACIITSGTWATGASQGYIHIINNQNATLPKSIHVYLITQAASAAAMVDISTASVAQINAIKLDRAGGNFNAGTVKLLGR